MKLFINLEVTFYFYNCKKRTFLKLTAIITQSDFRPKRITFFHWVHLNIKNYDTFQPEQFHEKFTYSYKDIVRVSKKEGEILIKTSITKTGR